MIIRIFFTLFLIVFTAQKASATSAQNTNYYKDESRRFRGWVWFEEKEMERQMLERKKDFEKVKEEISPDVAKEEIESLKEQMEERRNIMIVRPSAQNVRKYYELEKIMWDRALKLDAAYREAKFRYPELFDKQQDPTNVHAVKLKRKLDFEEGLRKIKDFAKEYDLVLFSKGDCRYSKEFAPILKNFSDTYGFVTEEISMDDQLTGLFRGKRMPDLALKLGIKVSPTIVAVSKDGSKAFEMMRGYGAVAELEEYAGLAFDYAKKGSKKKRGDDEDE